MPKAPEIGVSRAMKEIFLTATVVGLFTLGLMLSLWSGAVGLGRSRGLRVVAANLSALILRVVGLGAGLFAVQKIIGTPSVLGW
jgi:hypothetical protein